jgi:hypothetical protein
MPMVFGFINGLLFKYKIKNSSLKNGFYLANAFLFLGLGLLFLVDGLIYLGN